MARTLGVVTNLQRRIPRLGAPSTVYETVGRGASFMDLPDTKWSRAHKRPCRWLNGLFLQVSRSTRGYWLSKVAGEGRPTQHASREAAMRGAERRASRQTEEG